MKQTIKAAECGKMTEKTINGKTITARDYCNVAVNYNNVTKANDNSIMIQRYAFGNVADCVAKTIADNVHNKYKEIAKFSEIAADGKYMLDGVKFYAVVRKCVEPSGIIRVNVAVTSPATGKTWMSGSVTSLRKILAKIQAGK